MDNESLEFASSPTESSQLSQVSLIAADIQQRKPPNSDFISQEVIDRYIGSNESIDTEQIRLLLRDSRDSILKQTNDSLDYSNTPSYSKLQSPYHLICRERYRLTKKRYERQFQKEIKELVAQQSNAFGAVSLVRVMALTSLWPPLHTRRAIDNTRKKFFQLSPKQTKRLAYIMRVDWSKT